MDIITVLIEIGNYIDMLIWAMGATTYIHNSLGIVLCLHWLFY